MLRLRTADLCQECKKVMVEKGLKSDLARQIFALMDSVRERVLFRSRLEILQGISPLNVKTKNKKELVFTGYGVDPVDLAPLKMTVYLLFLRHPEGISLRYKEKYRDDLRRIYGMFSDEDEEVRIKRVEELINREKPKISWNITKINEALIHELGKKTAEKYIIQREKGRTMGGALKYTHFIRIDRKLVTINGEPFETGIRKYFPR